MAIQLNTLDLGKTVAIAVSQDEHDTLSKTDFIYNYLGGIILWGKQIWDKLISKIYVKKAICVPMLQKVLDYLYYNL